MDKHHHAQNIPSITIHTTVSYNNHTTTTTTDDDDDDGDNDR